MMRELLAVVIALGMVSSDTGVGELIETVRSLSKDDNKIIIANLVQEMHMAAKTELSSMPKNLNQYLLATPLVITTQKNKQSFDIDKSNVKFYINTNRYDRNEDCDTECLKEMDNIQTKYKPDALANKCGKKTEFHTELLFLYGKHFYKELRNGPKIFLVFSHYVPCSGLSKCSFGECAGDMAYHRHQYNNKGIYFIVIFEEYFIPGGQDTGSNFNLSKLYSALAGIPLWHCSFLKNTRPSCAPSNSDHTLLLTHVSDPVFHRFPRVYDKSRSKTEVFCDCLARGKFVQTVTDVDIPLQNMPETDEILAELVREIFLAEIDETSKIRNYFDFQRIVEKLKSKFGAKIDRPINHCQLFMACVENLKDGVPAHNQKLKKKLSKDIILRKLLDDICKNFGARLTLSPPKKRPDICPQKFSKA